MALDINGGLKNVRMNKNPHIVLEELISNAIDSYLIRRSKNSTIGALDIKLKITFIPSDLFGDKYFFDVSLTDNGAGFGDEQVKAFSTRDTSYKDRLGIEGIGRCKGSGRIQFFHYFKDLKIDSLYVQDNIKYRRTLTFRGDYESEIDETSFKRQEADPLARIMTVFTLENMKAEAYEKFLASRSVLDEFSAPSLKNYIMIGFLQRLVRLERYLGAFKISIETINNSASQVAQLVPADLPPLTTQKAITINYINENQEKTTKSEAFTIFHYKLDRAKYQIKSNTIALCAKSSIVKKITSRYLKNKVIENAPLDDSYHIILVESSFLDDAVSLQRDRFEIPQQLSTEPEGTGPWMTYREIYNELDPVIDQLIKPPGWDRASIVSKVEAKYGISAEMITDADVRIQSGDTEESVAKRVLRSYESRFLRDTSEIIDIKAEIEKTDPLSPEFRKRINDLAWKYASTLKTLDMTNLSQLVVRRSAIVEVLDMAVQKELLVQKNSEGKEKKDRERNEDIIHNIFFPQRRDSSTAKEHDIWILSEEYQYFDYIASDMPLSSYRPDLFELGIDEALNETAKRILEKQFNENYEANKAKRPDIAIFDKEGTAIIIEFKAPGVDLAYHTGDLREYAQLLTAKSKGRLKRFYGYLIGTIVDKNRIEYDPIPGTGGWSKTISLRDPDNDLSIGTLYAEVLRYDHIIKRARQRIGIYRNKLKIDFKRR